MPGKTQRLQAAERNEVYMTLRLPADLYDDLCALARGRFRSASDEARLALHQHVINQHNRLETNKKISRAMMGNQNATGKGRRNGK